MIVDFFKMLWGASRVGTAVIVIGLVLIVLILFFAFTNVWPTAHDWLNSAPCPDDRSCGWLRMWYW